jgi:hypothetical protein
MSSETALFPNGTPPARPAGASLTVTGQCVYLSPDLDAPVVAPLRFCRPLLTAEQPYGPRRLTVGGEWQALDRGWLAEAGASFLVLANDAPTFAVIPSAGQRAEAAAKVVEVYFAPPTPADAGTRTMFSPKPPDRTPFAALLIHPGEQQPMTPGGGEILVRCRAGEARCTLHLYPL